MADPTKTRRSSPTVTRRPDDACPPKEVARQKCVHPPQTVPEAERVPEDEILPRKRPAKRPKR